MPPLKQSERRLLAIFGIVVGLLLNILLVDWLLQQEKKGEALLSQSSLKLKTDQGWLADRDLWEDRGRWLDAQQPALSNANGAGADLLQSLGASAREQNIRIVDQEILPPRFQSAFQEIGVRMEVSGSLESMIRWLYRLQQPDLFQAAPSFALRSETDLGKVRCSLTVVRCFRLPGSNGDKPGAGL